MEAAPGEKVMRKYGLARYICFLFLFWFLLPYCKASCVPGGHNSDPEPTCNQGKLSHSKTNPGRNAKSIIKFIYNCSRTTPKEIMPIVQPSVDCNIKHSAKDEIKIYKGTIKKLNIKLTYLKLYHCSSQIVTYYCKLIFFLFR